jgi:hypothetical protein
MGAILARGIAFHLRTAIARQADAIFFVREVNPTSGVESGGILAVESTVAAHGSDPRLREVLK